MTGPKMKKSKRPTPDINRIVADILSGMSLKEKALIANMDEKSLPYLQYAFDVYLSQDVGDNPETGQEIMRRIWQTLQQTHRIRLVGKDG
jgi:predicted transcriptional regulator YdeE